MSAGNSRRLLDALFTTERMRGIFSDAGRLQGMLDFEAALARAQARAGVIPAAAGDAIAACCHADRFDIERLAAAAGPAGNVAIPLVKELTALVARDDADAARFVHWGATSQDAIDTGLVLQMRDALSALERDYAQLSSALADRAGRERDTLLAGRTWLQQAIPVTLGVKIATWLSAVERDRARIAAARERALVLQFGGATGTLASLGDKGIEVSAMVGENLALRVPEAPWHTMRDRVAEVAAVLGIAVGTLGKIARDISLLMQTEIGEAFEPAAPGRGGSSTMPHKRNPVGAAIVLAAALRVPNLVATMLAAMVQEHERGLGGWHAEWETLPDIFTLADGALTQTLHVITGLEVDRERMRANLGVTHGLLAAEGLALALGETMGKQQAHRLVETACREAVQTQRHLRTVLQHNDEVRERLSDAELDRLFDPAHALGCAREFIDRTLAARSS
ncbi:MAG TPA: 3-carboxy-cis,cis-muconate cycloisomerase [Casimicrobiaceae bacterium]|nr:3-carboxy-cis,cis-muconate cycloisomerase [Casimicrobiaceae bacterium]